MTLYLDVMVGWMIVAAILTVFGIFIGSIACPYGEERMYIARVALVGVLVTASGIVWPLAAPVIFTAAVIGLWKAADIEYTRIPRAERQRIKRELANAKADKILNDALREQGLR